MEHIPAIHAAKVGMRYPARVHSASVGGLLVELDLTTLAPGRDPTLRGGLEFTCTMAPDRVRELHPGERIEVVIVWVMSSPAFANVSLPADPAWLTWNNGTVRQLARRIRETAESDLLPILADALEEAGCTDHALLARCRRPENDYLRWLVQLLATQE